MPPPKSLKPELFIRIFAVFSLCALVIGIPTLIIRLFFPLQLQQGDAINVEMALVLLRGDNLYPDPAHGGPYLYSAYPPLFFWLQAGLLKFIHNIWLPGRLLAFLGYAGCGMLLGFWARRNWGWAWGLFLPSLFLIFPTWVRWATADRSDTLLIFFNFSAFLLLYRIEKEGNSSLTQAGGAGLLNAAALLMKQSALTLTLAYGFYCLLKGQWKRLTAFLVSSLFPVAVVFAWEQYRSGGEYYRHTVTWLDTGYDWGLLGYWLSHDFIGECGWLLAFLAVLLLSKRLHLLVVLQLAFSSMALLSLGRDGGAQNYWLEFLLYGIFTVGEGYHAQPAGPLDRWVRPSRLSWALVFLMFLGLVGALRFHWPAFPPAQLINEKYDAMLLLGKGESLALDTDLVVMARKRVWIQPFEYKAMVEKGYWSMEPLLKDIREKRFSTIEIYDIPKQYLLPQAVVDEIWKDYHLKVRKYGRLWLEPNPA